MRISAAVVLSLSVAAAGSSDVVPTPVAAPVAQRAGGSFAASVSSVQVPHDKDAQVHATSQGVEDLVALRPALMRKGPVGDGLAMKPEPMATAALPGSAGSVAVVVDAGGGTSSAFPPGAPSTSGAHEQNRTSGGVQQGRQPDRMPAANEGATQEPPAVASAALGNNAGHAASKPVAVRVSVAASAEQRVGTDHISSGESTPPRPAFGDAISSSSAAVAIVPPANSIVNASAVTPTDLANATGDAASLLGDALTAIIHTAAKREAEVHKHKGLLQNLVEQWIAEASHDSPPDVAAQQSAKALGATASTLQAGPASTHEIPEVAPGDQSPQPASALPPWRVANVTAAASLPDAAQAHGFAVTSDGGQLPRKGLSEGASPSVEGGAPRVPNRQSAVRKEDDVTDKTMRDKLVEEKRVTRERSQFLMICLGLLTPLTALVAAVNIFGSKAVQS